MYISDDLFLCLFCIWYVPLVPNYLLWVNKLNLNLDSVCYVIFKIIDNVNDEPIWQQTLYCYWYDQSRGGLCANEDACTFTLDELAKTMYKCYKTVQSPREFKETFPARSKKHFPDAFVLKNAWTYNIQLILRRSN